MVDQENQDVIISLLCKLWSKLDGEPAFVICRPDLHEAGGCDAIVLRKRRTFAIEHTRVDTSPQRTRYLLRLQQFAEPIIEALHARFPNDWFEVRIPAREVSTLLDPEGVAGAIVEQAAIALPTLRTGTRLVIKDAPGVPFTMMVFFGVRTYQEGRVTVGPYGPDDAQAVADMRRALLRKHGKLARYRLRGAATVLVLDVPETYAFHGYFWRMFLDLAQQVPHDGFDEVVLAGSWGGAPPYYHYLKRDGVLIRTGAEYADLIAAQQDNWA